MSGHVKTLIDWSAAGVMIATFLSWLPHIAAALTIIWTTIRICESRTAQRFIHWLKSK